MVVVVLAAGSVGADELAREAHLLERGSVSLRRAAVARLEAWPAGPEGARADRLLGRALDDGDPVVRAAAAAALASRGARGLADAIRVRVGAENDAGALASAIHALGRLGLAIDGPRINPHVLHRDPTVRRAAILALGDLDADGAREVALRMLDDPRGDDPGEGVRSAAAIVLGRRGREDDGSSLVKRLVDHTVDPPPGWLLRSALAEAIGRLGGEGSVDLLRRLLHDPDARVAVTAATGLAARGARNTLLGALGAPEPAVRAAAVGGVVQGRVTDGYPVLRALARRDPSRDVRWAATEALWRLEEREADRWVLDGLAASDPGVVLASHRLLVERLRVDHRLDRAAWTSELEHWWRRR